MKVFLEFFFVFSLVQSIGINEDIIDEASS
jgi:hypothetical protein